MSKKTLFRGISATSGVLLAIVMCGSIPLFKNSGMINQMLNLTTSKIVKSTSAATTDTEYYKNDFGTNITNKTDALNVEMAVADENVVQAEEGTVVLRNENNALPLAVTSKVTLFGNGYYHSRYNKSKEDSPVDSIQKMTFEASMKKVLGSDNVNTTLGDNVYSSLSTTSNKEVIEASIDDVKKYQNSWTTNYNDAAMVVLTRYGTEDSETAMLVNGNHYLGLSSNEKELFTYLQSEKKAGIIKKIIVVINSDQMMELGWLPTYDVDACVLAGIPGIKGYEGVANVIIGKVNASGHTVDTYAKNALSAPSCTYAGTENTQTWANVNEVNTAFSGFTPKTTETHVDHYVVYAENIYVGYKYYETRYEDSVMNQGNAKSSSGATDGTSWNYADEVAYTFGYGLSYTTFKQEIQSVNLNDESNTYTVSVKVTNTGTLAGKSVVQVYAQTPYGEYEKANKIEKSAIQLAGFEKTETLEPGASQTVEVPVERYLIASYDANKAKGYILSSGDYYFAIGESSHDALNNVLAYKGYNKGSGMVDEKGNAADGDKSKVYHWKQDTLDTDSFKYSRYTDAGKENVQITNQFDSDQLLTYGVDFTYLSRSDWQATYPSKAQAISASESMIEDLKSDWYEKPNDAPAISSFTQGATNGINFINTKDFDYYDDTNWNSFIDELTVDDMLALKIDNNGAAALEDVAMPSQARGDDGVCIQQGSLKATGKNGIPWVSEVITARTWNKERFEARGKMLGIESVFCGINELWYGGGNVHRTPYGGRNMQYYSEDGNMGYYVSQYEAKAMQSVGVIYGIKHFALNDQEAYRESLATFANEQTIREEYLRSFEGAVCKGGTLGLMTGFNRIGCDYVATNKSLLTNVLRQEWNFKGHITTDAGDASYKAHQLEQLAAGIDYTCWNQKKDLLQTAIDEGDGNILKLLRQSAKHNVYAASRTISVNGLSSDSIVIKITPWWETAIVSSAIALTGVATCSAIAYAVFEVCEKQKMLKNGKGQE
jgi:beta-glucosidase